MNRTVIAFLLLGTALSLSAQVKYKSSNTSFVVKQWKVDFSDEKASEAVIIPQGEVDPPEPVMLSHQLKEKLDAQRQRQRDYKQKQTSYLNEPADVNPAIQAELHGRPRGGSGIPNDNTMAISNDGVIISAINSSITVLAEDGTFLLYRRLEFVTQGQLPNLNRTYDPKVTYDPVNDRFILVFLQGSTSADTRIVVGFTETNDPTASWNFYAVNGNPFGEDTWSDYPIIAQSGKDLYITVNLLRDNMSWQAGFVQSFIWQINKADGYAGNALTQNLYYDIEYNGKSVWSICPVQPAMDFTADNMYFLSVRPDAEQNDTVFLHEITDHSKSGVAEHQLQVLKANKQYGVPPSAFQPEVGYRLQTNDTRVLSATIHRNNIHYVQSSVVYEPLRSGVFHGVIYNVEDNPTIDANLIASEKLDYAYPSIAFSGEEESDEHSMLITFSHAGEWDYPGTSAIFHNRHETKEGLYSEPIMVKQGRGVINTWLPDSIERWGDYTDVQRKYNEPGAVWLCGSYGDSIDRNNVWLAKLKVNNHYAVIDRWVTYPNPANESIQLAFVLDGDKELVVQIIGTNGQIVKEVEGLHGANGGNRLLMDLSDVLPGLYIVALKEKNGTLVHSERVVVE